MSIMTDRNIIFFVFYIKSNHKILWSGILIVTQNIFGNTFSFPKLYKKKDKINIHNILWIYKYHLFI